MERELTQRCQRSVRVAEFVPMDVTRTIKTGSDEAAVSSCKMPLFAGYVEALYARNAWLAVRVDIWTSSDICFRQVKWANVFLQERKEEVAMPVTNGGAMVNLQKVEKVDLGMEDRGDIPALTGKELTNVLEDVVNQVIDEFQALQVQALQAATSPRAKFEYEMLQHHPALEILVLSTQKGESFVLFALPLLGRKSHWDPNKLIGTGNLDSVFIPDGFHAPNFSVSTDGIMIFIGYPLKEEVVGSEGAWPLVVEWPARMELSSQVTHIPPSSKGQSSVELIASCKKMFLQQWRRRKDFVSELRRHVIVLEYDAVDFSQVFFILQEQLNEQAPLRIIVLQLQFTAAFFLTNCMSDLQVTLLDGGEGGTPVPAALEPSSNPSSASSSADSVVQFLESTQKSLLRHFYGE